MTPLPDDEEDFAKLLAEFEGPPKKGRAAQATQKGPQVGDLVRARVVSIGKDAVFVDLGAKAEGMIDLVELRGDDGIVQVRVGDQVEARVVDLGGKAGCVVLRRHGLGRGAAAKAELEQAAAHGIPVEGTVTGVNKGGVEVQVAGERGFCPMSQLDLRHVDDPAVFIGRKLEFKITKYDVSGRFADLVLSRRSLLEEEKARRAADTRRRLEPGAVMKGTVSTLKDYGAFVDLGGIEGMIHVSELGFARGLKPSEVLSVGQEVEVVVLRIEKAAGERGERVALSLKALEKDPWSTAADDFPPGRRLTAKVTRVEQFGAFLELQKGLEGLLHISELGGGQPLRHAKERAKVGDQFEVLVQQVDADKRRISLALTAKIDAETVDSEGRARAEAPRSLGTLGDLLKKATGASAGQDQTASANDKGKRRR
jgi:small subunit ribosomal protein S1